MAIPDPDDDSLPADLFDPASAAERKTRSVVRRIDSDDADFVPADIFGTPEPAQESESAQIEVPAFDEISIETEVAAEPNPLAFDAAMTFDAPAVDDVEPMPIARLDPVVTTDPVAADEYPISIAPAPLDPPVPDELNANSTASVAWPEPGAPVAAPAIPDPIRWEQRPTTYSLDEREAPPPERETTSPDSDTTSPKRIQTASWFKPFPVAPPIRPFVLPPTPPIAEPAYAYAPEIAAATPSVTTSDAQVPVMTVTSRDDAPQSTAPRIPFTIDRLLRVAVSLGASTVYLSSNIVPSVRVDSVVQPVDEMAALGEREIETLLTTLKLTYHGNERDPLAVKQLNFELQDVGRVRCLTFQDSRGPGAVFQLARSESLGGATADLSLDIQALAIEREGLIVIAGPRASGKQELIAGLVGLITQGRRAYVITVQREVSSSEPGERSFISHREAPGGLDDMLSVAHAALKENPDVLVLEDVSSARLMSLALDAAASGQLVIAGMNASGACEALNRIIDLYPPERSREVHVSLARQLRGVVGQVLLPRIGGGHVAARELLLNTKPVAAVLAAGKAEHLSAAMIAGRNDGMILIEDVLVELVQRGVVAAVDAYREAADPAAFIDALKRAGIDTSFVRKIE